MRQRSHGAATWLATVAPPTRPRTAFSSPLTTTRLRRRQHSPLDGQPRLLAPALCVLFLPTTIKHLKLFVRNNAHDILHNILAAAFFRTGTDIRVHHLPRRVLQEIFHLKKYDIHHHRRATLQGGVNIQVRPPGLELPARMQCARLAHRRVGPRQLTRLSDSLMTPRGLAYYHHPAGLLWMTVVTYLHCISPESHETPRWLLPRVFRLRRTYRVDALTLATHARVRLVTCMIVNACTMSRCTVACTPP